MRLDEVMLDEIGGRWKGRIVGGIRIVGGWNKGCMGDATGAEWGSRVMNPG